MAVTLEIGVATDTVQPRVPFMRSSTFLELS